mgnify:CR=1 FL=1
MTLRNIGRSAVLAGSLLFTGCETFNTPLATIGGKWIYPYIERKEGAVAAQGLVATPAGITSQNISEIFIDGGSRVMPSVPDGIVDEYIVVTHEGRSVYARSSYTGMDGISHDLHGSDEHTLKFRDITRRTLDAATQAYNRYWSILRSVGK